MIAKDSVQIQAYVLTAIALSALQKAVSPHLVPLGTTATQVEAMESVN